MKAIGMIHIKGVNDKAWKEFLASSNKKNISPCNLTLCNRKINKAL